MEQEARVVPRAAEAGMDFDGFYRAEHLRLYRSMLLITGRRSEAEDLAHEAFVRVLERWDRVAGMERPRAYLYRTAINLHRNGLRRASRRARRAIFEREVVEDFAPDAVERLHVVGVLMALPRAQREALVLTELVDMSSREAATVLGIDERAVRARVHRARVTAREELEDDG